MVLLVTFALAACGGGSSGSSPSQSQPVSTNNNPIIELETSAAVSANEPLRVSPTVTDADGDTITYKWAVNNDDVTIEDDDSQSTTFNFPASNEEKTYTLTLTATDSKGASSSKAMLVKVAAMAKQNQAPIIELVESVDVNNNEPLTVNPTVSDPDGDSLIFEWSTSDEVNFSNSNDRSTTFSFPERDSDKSYALTLTVTDSKGAWSAKIMTVNVLGKIPDNKSPIIDLMSNKTVESNQTVLFSPTVSDPENDELSYQWSSDDASVIFSDSTLVESSVTFPAVSVQRKMTISLTVTDSHGNESIEHVEITLKPKDTSAEPTAPLVSIFNTTSGNSLESVTIKARIISLQEPTLAVWTLNKVEVQSTGFTKLSDNHYQVDWVTARPLVEKFTAFPVTLTVTTDSGLSTTDEDTIFVSPNKTPSLSVTLPSTISIDEKANKVVYATIDNSHQIDSYNWKVETGSGITLLNASTDSVTIVTPEVSRDMEALLTLIVTMGDETRTVESTIRVNADKTSAPITLEQSRITAGQGQDIEISVISDDFEQLESFTWAIQGLATIDADKTKTSLRFTVPKVDTSVIVSVIYTATLKNGSTLMKIANLSLVNEAAIRNSLTITPPSQNVEVRNNVQTLLTVLVVDSLALIDSIAITQPFTVNTFEPIVIKKATHFIQVPLKTNTIEHDHFDFLNLQIKVGVHTFDYPLQLVMKAN